MPPITAGLVGYYTGTTWTGTQWNDISGQNNHATVRRGTISKGGADLNHQDYVWGPFDGNLRFPAAILPSTYTLLYVARQTSNQHRGRIFDGVNTNWLSGFWGAVTGVAFHNNFITQSTADVHGTAWVLGTDQNDLFRSNKVNRTTASPGTPSHAQLSIGYGLLSQPGPSDERCPWAVATVLVYNRKLTLAEYTSVENWLAVKYGLPF
jgi:hypothetical protein